MHYFLTILLLLPLAAGAGQLLGRDISSSTAAARTAIENAERHKGKATTPPPKVKKSREQLMREARQRMDAADRERERRGGAFAR